MRYSHWRAALGLALAAGLALTALTACDAQEGGAQDAGAQQTGAQDAGAQQAGTQETGAAADAARPALLDEAEQLFVLANQARAAVGEKPLSWDPALTSAALAHCRLMAVKGPIAHQYAGEPALETRAAKAGAHFSLIAENVAVGSTPAQIEDNWMHSAGHRANLLNPNADRLGVAVVEARGVLYAVEDFSRAEPVLTRSQVEIVISRLVGVNGITILADNAAARAYCAGASVPGDGMQPSLMVKWQGPSLTELPTALASRLASGQFHQAQVGSCAPEGVKGSFTVYRVGVLLY